MSDKVVIFDVETVEAGQLYNLPPEEMFRLGGYKFWGEDEVYLTTDLEEMRRVLLSAKGIIGHNIWAFDLKVVFGYKSDLLYTLAEENKVLDTFIHAALVNPAPYEYVNRHGQPALAAKPEQAVRWFGLDEQAYQLGVTGKLMDLKDLAREFGDPELKPKARELDGYGKIPVTDRRYRDYLEADVRASEAVARELLKLGPLNDYAKREQRVASRAAIISSNGFRVDKAAAEARVEYLAERREAIMKDLVRRYNFPTEGESPWLSRAGKWAILDALADAGITPETIDWPKTDAWEKREEHLAKAHEKRGALKAEIKQLKSEIDDLGSKIVEREYEGRPTAGLRKRIKSRRKRIIAAEEKLEEPLLSREFGLSLGGEALLAITKDTEAEELGRALSELMGQRSLAQLALDSMHNDGRVHPDITMLQKSGRWSTTNPGLTIWDPSEKYYFLPDNDNHVLLGLDYSNADARIVAAYSGDEVYQERFAEGVDGHMISAWAAFGKDVVGTDKSDPKTAAYRKRAKPLIHGWSYGGQAKTLSKVSGVPLENTKKFCDGMAERYSVLVQWQDYVRRQARKGYVMNDWGRKMWVEKGREFTQAPALMGQSGTREIVCDALLAMPLNVLRTVKAQIHDELIFSVPKARWEECRDYLIQLMSTSFKPQYGGQLIEFPVSSGPAGANWQEATHE